MEIVQEEKNGIVCVTVKGRMEAGLAPAFEKKIKEIFEVNRFKGSITITITDSVESGLVALSCCLKVA